MISCSSAENLSTNEQNPTTKKKKKLINPDHMSKAIEHFTNGKLLQSQGENLAALNEFYEALLYDQNSSEIYKSIAGILLETNKYESAKININKALKLDPDDIETIAMLASCNLQMRNINDAISNYLRVLELDNTHEKAFEMLLSLYEFNSDQDAALNVIDKYSMHFLESANISYSIAVFYYKQKKYAQSKTWIDRSLAIEADYEKAQLLSSELELIQGDGAKALDNLVDLYRKDPKNDRLLFNIVTVLREQKKNQQIIELLEKKTLISEQLKLLLGESYYNTQQYTKVLQTYSNLPLKRTDVYFMYIAADSEYKLKNYESSFAYYNDIITMNPTIAQGYYGAALCLVQQKNYADAESIIRSGLRKTKDHNALYQLLTETLVSLNRHKEAENYLEDLIRKNPNDINTIASVANAYQKMNDFEKSDQLFEYALKVHPDNDLILNNYSYSLSKRNIRLNDALRMIEKALVKSPNNHNYLDTIGWVYYRMQKYNKARIFVEKALITNTSEESYEVYDHLGDIYFALQENSKALKYWKKALELDPNQKLIREKVEKYK